MLTTDQINDLHRLYWSERWPIRKIERHLRMSWQTIKKYLDAPAQAPAARSRTSKLDPFKATIAEWLEKDARRHRRRHRTATAAARLQRRPQHPARVCAQRSPAAKAQARLRAHGTPARRTLRSRLGSLRRARLLRRQAQTLCLRAGRWRTAACCIWSSLTARASKPSSVATCMPFTALGGVRREIAYDNLATAVAEHDGRLVRFLPRFLGFAREYGFYPASLQSGERLGKRQSRTRPSAICARTSGRCASSPICTM